jgi:hypothetical protein
MASTGTKWGIGIGAFLLAAAHGSGALRALEEPWAPGLARLSTDIIHVGQPIITHTSEIEAAQTALTEALKGNEVEQVVASTACTLLNSGIENTTQYRNLVSDINSELSPEWQTDSYVQGKVKVLADKIQGALEPGGTGAWYRRACLRG